MCYSVTLCQKKKKIKIWPKRKKVVKKLSKKKKKLSESSQKVFKRLSKSCKKSVKKLSKQLSESVSTAKKSPIPRMKSLAYFKGPTLNIRHKFGNARYNILKTSTPSSKSSVHNISSLSSTPVDVRGNPDRSRKKSREKKEGFPLLLARSEKSPPPPSGHSLHEPGTSSTSAPPSQNRTSLKKK
jgi:hypothetical protein